MHNEQHLIIGSHGKTGSRVIRQLTSLGYNPKGASRHGDVTFDWHDRSTWAAAITGIDSVYLTYFPDLAIPKAPDDISQFCALAKQHGIKHITLLSGRGEDAAKVCEEIVKSSGLSWTIVRAAWFNQNFSEGLFRQFILSGKMALPVNAVTEPFVDTDDIADVVAASLTEPGHQHKLYEVTGPELLSFHQLAKRFSAVNHIDVIFESITLSQFQQNMHDVGASESEVEMLTYLFSEVLDGRNAYMCDGIQQALGRAPRSFSQYIQDNLTAFSEER